MAGSRVRGRLAQRLRRAGKRGKLTPQGLQVAVVRSDPGLQLHGICGLAVERVEVRDAGSREMRPNLAVPAFLQRPDLHLRLAPPASNENGREVTDADLDLGAGFNFDRLRDDATISRDAVLADLNTDWRGRRPLH